MTIKGFFRRKIAEKRRIKAAEKDIRKEEITAGLGERKRLRIQEVKKREQIRSKVRLQKFKEKQQRPGFLERLTKRRGPVTRAVPRRKVVSRIIPVTRKRRVRGPVVGLRKVIPKTRAQVRKKIRKVAKPQKEGFEDLIQRL